MPQITVSDETYARLKAFQPLGNYLSVTDVLLAGDEAQQQAAREQARRIGFHPRVPREE